MIQLSQLGAYHSTKPTPHLMNKIIDSLPLNLADQYFPHKYTEMQNKNTKTEQHNLLVLKFQSLQDVDHITEFFQEHSGYHEGLHTRRPNLMSGKLCIYVPEYH